jgi:hypothetical protein
MNKFNSLLIYVLSSTANGQLLSQNEYEQQQYDSTGQNKRNNKKKNQFKLLTLELEFLHISLSLQTAFAVETHLAEGQ